MVEIVGTLASETLEGGSGQDHIEDRLGGSDVLRGGSGADTLIVSRQSNMAVGVIQLEGGDGNDTLSYQGYNASTVTMDGGAGADSFSMIANAGAVTIVTGAGADTISLHQFFSSASGSLVVTDFTTGAGGDALDWTSYLGVTLSNWDATNPFGSGHLRLVQSGSDTLIQMDRDGGGGLHGYSTLMTLQGVTNSTLTSMNLGGFTPSGGAQTGQTFLGSSSADSIDGTSGADVINGLGGNDTVQGGAGDDQIDGGDGADRLFGGFGNDLVLGGEGNDHLEDRDGGSDTMRGGGGADTLIISRQSNMAVGAIRLEGGEGDDSLSYQGYTTGSVTMDGGGGADLFTVIANDGAVVITTGAGSDRISLHQFYANASGRLTVSDFATGADGDAIDWTSYLATTLSNWSGSDPFASGHLRMTQSGADTLILIDRDGSGGVYSYSTLVTLQGVNVGSLTTANLGGFAPSGIYGTASSDIINGQAGADQISGGDGADTITAGQGNDVVDGEGGADIISGDEGNDTIRGGADFDQINGNMGNDIGYGGEGNDWVVGGKDQDLLYGDNGDDVVYGNLGNDTCYGGEGADWVRGGQGDDIIDGGAGNDWMAGDRGNDTVTGGGGADRFYFFAGAAIDRVTDFSSAAGDRVLLDAGQAYTLSYTTEGAVIDLGHGDQMILVGVTQTTLGDWLLH